VAQPYPSHPITLIVPFGAGGPVDTLARTLTDAMRTSLGQAVIIENVTGASGTIGVGRAVRAAPDGYTVSIGNWPSHVVNGAIYALPYDVLKDFEPVARLPSNPYVIVARKDLPASNLKELIAWLKANPDKATQGTAGPGSGQHVSGVYFQNVTGTRFQFVPYRAGSSEIMRDLLSGHIDLSSTKPSQRFRTCAAGESKPTPSRPTTAWLRPPISPRSTRPARPGCTSPPGTECGSPREHHRRPFES